MIRFWFEFEEDINFSPKVITTVGCGVTAYDNNDAIQLLHETVFRERTMPTIKRTVENVDVSELDEGHVIPNMGNIFERGIWFPLGYSECT